MAGNKADRPDVGLCASRGELLLSSGWPVWPQFAQTSLRRRLDTKTRRGSP